METSENSQLMWKALEQLRGPLDAQDAEQLLLAVIFLRCVADVPDGAATADAPSWRWLVDQDSYGLTDSLEWALDAWTRPYRDGGRRLTKSIPDHHVARPLLREAVRLIDRAERPVELYEECLERFSHTKSGGNYFTPRPLVRLLVDLLEPRPGEWVFDPACGSGGFLAEAARHVRERHGRQAAVELSGRDINPRARQIAWMNLTARGLEADLGEGPVDSLRFDDAPRDTFDVVFANPPFNLKHSDDLWQRHWRYGEPPRNNANFAWVQHVVSKLTDRGRAAMLLPDGATFTAGAARQIRRGLVMDDVLSAVVALPPGLFPHTGISASIWIFSREKPSECRGQVLFIDARGQGSSAGRGRRSLSEGDIERIASTYRSWGGAFEDRVGWCRSASMEEIAEKEFNLYAAGYVGAAAVAPVPERADERVAELTRELYGHFAEAARLEDELRDILEEM
ncbi:N-6 DNA methylase [Streptomyces decoyicus]|uniref:N-6 DNA methylase n=1 Tax=Streptomyces decoyicus TaxID=249567 RepID=UPI0037F9D624